MLLKSNAVVFFVFFLLANKYERAENKEIIYKARRIQHGEEYTCFFADSFNRQPIKNNRRIENEITIVK